MVLKSRALSLHTTLYGNRTRGKRTALTDGGVRAIGKTPFSAILNSKPRRNEWPRKY